MPFQLSLQAKIRQGFNMDSWRHAGTNKHGVCLYELIKGGKVVAHGTMLQLYNQAIEGK